MIDICVYKKKELEGKLKTKKCRRCDGKNHKCIIYYNQKNSVFLDTVSLIVEDKQRPDWVFSAYEKSDKKSQALAAAVPEKEEIVEGWLISSKSDALDEEVLGVFGASIGAPAHQRSRR